MRITIETIPSAHHRYPTAGDWQFNSDKDELTIKVSSLGNWKQEALIGIHELVEALLCKDHGVSGGDVDRFDEGYERRRQHNDTSEPGDDPSAPYYREHQFASVVERLISFELGVDWSDYDAAIGAL